MRKWILFVLTFLLLLFFFFNFYHILKKRVVTSEFKSQTEKKLSQLLNAKVKVGKIRFGLLRHVSLTGLQIGKLDSKVPIQLDVQRITIKYNLTDFLGQNFKVPAEVSIDAPVINFESMVSPFDVLHLLGIKQGSGSGLLKKVELNDGQFQVKFPNSKEPLLIRNIKGKMSIENGDVVHLNFKGELDGVAIGQVTIRGELVPDRKKGQIELLLENVALKNSSIPVKNLNGKILVSDSNIQFDNLKFDIRNLPIELSGKIEQAFEAAPNWEFHLQLPQMRKKAFQLDVSGEMGTRSISGRVNSLGSQTSFEGKFGSFAKGIELEVLRFDNGYEAYGAFDYETGLYSMRLQKGIEQFGFDVSLKDLKTDLHVDINHWNFGGHDFTTNANFSVEPIDSRWELGDYRFKCRMQTNYLILDYHPLRDFMADFEISEFGVNPLRATWGSESKLDGSMSFGETASVDLNVQIGNVELREVQSLGLHPLPTSLAGKLEGTIRIIGVATNPDVSGRLIVRNGKISDFKYDEALIEFYGVMPRVKLLDSKIVKKDNTFLIQGEVDFGLKNVLQKVKIVSLEQVIIWKGLDVESEVENRSIQLPVAGKAVDILKPLNASNPAGAHKIKAEYDMGSNRSIQVTAEDEKGGSQVVTVGPKIRF